MDAKELAQRLTRDAVGCLHGAAGALVEDGGMTYTQRLEWIDLIETATRLMAELGGPDELSGQTSLHERQEDSEEVIKELQEG